VLRAPHPGAEQQVQQRAHQDPLHEPVEQPATSRPRRAGRCAPVGGVVFLYLESRLVTLCTVYTM
jgi:hypothetical protein